MIGTVYKITDKDGEVYYGSTISKLWRRLSQHKTHNNNCITKTMDKESMTIEALEEYYFDEDTYNKKFIEKRERSYIDSNQCINKQHPCRTKQEHYRNNKQSINEKAKEYREKNKQSIRERQNEKLGCRICRCMVTRSNFSTHLKTKKHQSNLIGTKS